MVKRYMEEVTFDIQFEAKKEQGGEPGLFLQD
jgi:hypothetical protein